MLLVILCTASIEYTAKTNKQIEWFWLLIGATFFFKAVTAFYKEIGEGNVLPLGKDKAVLDFLKEIDYISFFKSFMFSGITTLSIAIFIFAFIISICWKNIKNNTYIK